MIIILSCVLAASSLANLVLLVLWARHQPGNRKPEYTYDAQALLRDLMSGPALLKIDYLDRSEVLLRSPRNM